MDRVANLGMTESQRKELWPKWRRLINMTPREIKDFLATPEGKAAGLTKTEAQAQGIARGRDSGRALIRMLPKGGRSYEQAKKNWSGEDWRWAKRQYAFNSRMRGAAGPLLKRGKMTRRLTSLLIWGHDPRKPMHRTSNPGKQISKPISFMRLRHLDAPKDLLKLYKASDLVVQQKYDGFKVMAISTKRGIKLYSRRGTDITARAPQVIQRLQSKLGPGDTVLGEMVYYHRGKQDIQKLQSVLGSKTGSRAVAKFKELGGQMDYVVYDLLSYQGQDLTDEPLVKRKTVLDTLLPSRGMVHVVKDYTWGQRKRAMNESLAKGGEGIVVKVKASDYKYRKLGASEPFGMWWKHKPPGKSAYTADVILTKYKKGKEKLIFDAYQLDADGKRISVGRLSGMDRATEKQVKGIIDRGKEVVAEVSYQKRLPSKKMRHMGWIRLRIDKPVQSATVEQIRPKQSGRKKRSKITKAVKRNPKDYAVYLTVERPRAIEVHAFHSADLATPAAAAYAHGLEIQAKHPELRIQILDGKQLAACLRKAGKGIKPGRQASGRVANPRRSVLKDALAVELLQYKTFDDFARAYWENCARGIYWYPTNDRKFAIGAAEKKLCEEGKFFVGCNPELALKGPRGKGKKYVAELKVTALGTKDYRVKRGSGGAEIKIVRNLNRVKVLRVLSAEKAARSLIWQQSILPSSKDELRKFYDEVVKKHGARQERESEKRVERKRREELRAKHLSKEAAAKAKRKRLREEAEQEREIKEFKKAAKKAAKKRVFKRTRKEVKREQEERRRERERKAEKKATKKKPSTKLAKRNPTRTIRAYVNNPGVF